MACNRETSADGTTSAASGCQNPDALVPCCNNNCCFLGCAATMNLCSKCYSEHLLEEGGLYASKQRVDPCDPTTDTLVVRSSVGAGADGVGGINETRIGGDESTEGYVDASSLVRMAEDMSANKLDNLRPALRSNSASPSDLRTVLRPADTSTTMVDTVIEQRIPSLFTISPIELAPRQIETGLSRPLQSRQQAVNRCLACRKRIGLIGFKCRCGDLFCGLHRYSDKHDCSFDYKAAGRAAIAKENPVVKASKIEKI